MKRRTDYPSGAWETFCPDILDALRHCEKEFAKVAESMDDRQLKN
jgi:hypothetical protein